MNRPTELPFLSHFNRGHGNGMYIEGKRVSTDAWFHLSLQDRLPTENYSSLHASHQWCEFSCLAYDEEIGFNGGGCLILERQFDASRSFPLFYTHFPCSMYPKVQQTVMSRHGSALQLYISLVYASELPIAIQLELSIGNGTVALCVVSDVSLPETVKQV